MGCWGPRERQRQGSSLAGEEEHRVACSSLGSRQWPSSAAPHVTSSAGPGKLVLTSEIVISQGSERKSFSLTAHPPFVWLLLLLSLSWSRTLGAGELFVGFVIEPGHGRESRGKKN